MFLPELALRAAGTPIAVMSAVLVLAVSASEPACAQELRDRTPRIAVVSVFAPDSEILRAELGNVPTYVETGLSRRRPVIIMRPVRGGRCRWFLQHLRDDAPVQPRGSACHQAPRRRMRLPASGIPEQVPQCHPGSSPSPGARAGLPDHPMGALDHVRPRQGAPGLLRQSGPGRPRIPPGPDHGEGDTRSVSA